MQLVTAPVRKMAVSKILVRFIQLNPYVNSVRQFNLQPCLFESLYLSRNCA